MFDPAERIRTPKAEPSTSLSSSILPAVNANVDGAADFPRGVPDNSVASPFAHFADADEAAAVPSGGRKPAPDKKTPAKKPTPKKEEPPPEPKVPEGLFPGVQDLTSKYGKLASGPRSSTTDSVIMHRTHAAKGSSTLSGYDQQIKDGKSRGAQYLIDENGQTMLITGSDQKTTHVQNNNSTAVGIEVTGPGVNLMPALNQGKLREKLEGMNLSPAYKERLLGYDDKTLNQMVKSNAYEGESSIYEDISGKQKRSVWNLTTQLTKKYGLDINDTSTPGKNESGQNHYTNGQLPDISAHEQVQAKSMGEGEPMIEFIKERGNYPKLVAQAQKKLAEMEAAGASPEQMARMQEMVLREQSTLSALNVDGTQKEIDAVKAEKDGGKPGEATLRENSRTTFYDNFYDRIGALKKAVK